MPGPSDAAEAALRTAVRCRGGSTRNRNDHSDDADDDDDDEDDGDGRDGHRGGVVDDDDANAVWDAPDNDGSGDESMCCGCY